MRVRVLLLSVLIAVMTPAAASARFAHVVQRGETLTSIAAVDGLTVAALARANGISPTAELVAGQTLWIPPRSAATASGGTTSATSSSTAGSSSSATRSTGTHTTAVANGGPIPTAEFVSSGTIAAIAGANGVSPALAEAVAWQESGWNNAKVSSIGAVGVMQIIPRTWTWIDQYLTPEAPLGTASASENVRAGVLLLRELLAETGGDERLAVAGYFQGLASVRRIGMDRSTRRYVANVMALAYRFGGA